MKQPRKEKSKTTIKPKQAKPSRDLLVIDNKPIRDSAIKKCKAIIKKLEKTKTAWEAFESRDKPAYSRWFHSTFGALISSIREASEKLDELSALIDDIHEARFDSNLSYHAAYEYVMKRRSRFEIVTGDELRSDYEKAQSSAEEENSADDWNADEPWEGDEIYEESVEEQFEAFMDFVKGNPFLSAFLGDEKTLRSMFEKISSQINEQIRKGPTFFGLGEDEAPAKSDGIKSLYRGLVRKLHPDFRKGDDPRLDDLWNRVQNAYEEEDIEALEMLVSLCDISILNNYDACSVSQMLTIVEEHRSQIRLIEKNIRLAKKDPSWNFSTDPAISDLLAREIGNDLKSELADIQARVIADESTLSRWSQPPVPKKKKPKVDQVSEKQLDLFSILPSSP